VQQLVPEILMAEQVDEVTGKDSVTENHIKKLELLLVLIDNLFELPDETDALVVRKDVDLDEAKQLQRLLVVAAKREMVLEHMVYAAQQVKGPLGKNLNMKILKVWRNVVKYRDVECTANCIDLHPTTIEGPDGAREIATKLGLQVRAQSPLLQPPLLPGRLNPAGCAARLPSRGQEFFWRLRHKGALRLQAGAR
jgi:hypothetical protein